MDAIGISQAITVATPGVPLQPQVRTTGSSLPPPVDNSASQEASFDAQAADQQRLQAVRQMAHDIANVYIVSDTRFTIFKDTTGQYITRFTSLRDGRVTYIPEPTLFKMHSGGQVPALLRIEA